jgi:beta-ketodecanoyl-[acyl-carrier-protein] synthase
MPRHESPDSLKRLWLHQANLNMNVLIARRVLGREVHTGRGSGHPRRVCEYQRQPGSVIAFHKHHDDFSQGERGVLCSFGAGYSIGSVVLERC